jgi:hypothetical protein
LTSALRQPWRFQSLGLDLDAIRDRVEADFGPDALQPRAAPRRPRLLGRPGRVPERDGVPAAVVLTRLEVGPAAVRERLIGAAAAPPA